MTEAVKGKLSLGAMLRLGETEESRSPVTVADQAQWFVDHEIAVVPTKDKRPLGGVQEGKLSIEGIKDQYGVILGSGYIGIDFDEYHGAENLSLFGVTRRWMSGSGKGYGLILKVPKELSDLGFRLSPGIDVRGSNQILVGPGSKHPSGGTYKLIQDIEIIEASEWLIEILRKKLEETNNTNLDLGPQVQPDWLFKDERFKAKFDATSLTSDRSSATYAIVAYSTERGATNEELAWIISNFKPAIEKGNLQDELPRVIKKVRLLHEHPGKPCDSADCKNPPDWMKKALEPFDFWTERPEFTYIKQAAEARLVPPKAVMVAVLCRLAAALPTEIVLPPTVGKKASLNFFACFVGSSSDGKGTSTGLAEELFNFKNSGMVPVTSTPGSGEGVVSTYLKLKESGWSQVNESALINFDEIDNLKASSDRQGSTLSAILRQAFMGEQIGGTYSRAIKELLPHSYRMALQLSAQPLRSAGLLEDSDGGLPQRFIFVQTTNDQSPDVDDLPEFPAPTEWRIPQGILELKRKKAEAKEPNPTLGKVDVTREVIKEYIEIELHPVIAREIKINRIERLRRGSAGINGHADLVRLKVASLLAILDGRLKLDLSDWKLAKVIMTWSNQALNEIKEALQHKKLREEQSRSTAAANRTQYIEKTTEDAAIGKVAENLLSWLNKGVTHLAGTGSLKQKIRRDKNHLIDDAIELLIKQDKAKISEDGKNLELK